MGHSPAHYSDRHAAFKYNARQKPVPVETTQFARVMRELGIQQIFALLPQAKGRVERTLETFQDPLVTELRLTGASTIDHASEILQEFLPRFNARFAVAAEQPETAYRQVPAELALTETIDEWTEVFGSERLTGALLDRLTHHVHILEMNGESYRLNRGRENAGSQASDDA